MFYDKLKELCNKKGVKPSRVAIECGFSKGTVSHWKNDGTIPQRDILLKIANYFDVSVDHLLGNDEKEPIQDNSDETLMFALYGGDTKDITPEMLEDVRNFAKFIREKKNSEK